MASLHAPVTRRLTSSYRPIAELTSRALVLRLAVAVLLHIALEESAFAPDQVTYHSGAVALVRYWDGETDTVPWVMRQSGRNAYFFLVAALYWVFGAFPLIPKMVNAFAGALAVPLVADIAQRVTGETNVGVRAAKYVAYFPSLVLWSALNIRDVWVVLLILVISRQALIVQERFRLSSVFTLAAAIVAIVHFRDYLFLAIVAPVLVSFIVRIRGSVGKNAVVGLAIALAAVAADQIVGSERRMRTLDLESLSQIRSGTAIGGTTYEPKVDISTPGAAITFLPKGLAFFLFGPFPWTIRNLRQAITLPEMLFFYTLVPAIVSGAVFLIKHRLRDALMVLLITAAVTLGYALGQANQGTAYRHRAQVLPFYLLLGAMGHELRRRKARPNVGVEPHPPARRARP